MNDSPAPETAEASAAGEYQVLARKYRPSTFSGLIGQDAMVRTLTNAFASNRLHHAFVMTGVRGVGKTSTARIIARARTKTTAEVLRRVGAHDVVLAEDEAAVREHAKLSGFPASKITEVRGIIDPMTAAG